MTHGSRGRWLVDKHAEVAQDVPNTTCSEHVVLLGADPAAAELGGDDDLALALGLDRQQTVASHLFARLCCGTLRRMQPGYQV